MIKEAIQHIIDGFVQGVDYTVEVPDERFGDYATNVAMKLASKLRRNPVEIAKELSEKLKGHKAFREVSVAGSFINFRLSDDFYLEIFNKLKAEPFPRNGKRLLIEFGSANPTGPLHVGHGRNLIVGDVLAKILEYSGYEVVREYYINDHGVQVENLAASVRVRLAQLQGEKIELPEDGYHADYIAEIAKEFKESKAEDMKSFSLSWALERIRSTLDRLAIRYDSWFSEAGLYKGGRFEEILSILQSHELVYEKDGAIWVKTSLYGDEKDRVIVKQDENTSYFASDLMYSKDKVDRGYDKSITLLGADHHGYVARYLASFLLHGYSEAYVKLIQLVSFFRGGEQVKMSKRAGNFFTLDELIDEVGADACRIFFLTRKADSSMDFDIELAKEESSNNPVYYLQYAHARISSLLDKVGNVGKMSRISTEEERRIIKKLSEFHEAIEKANREMEPHTLLNYALELAALYHSFYNANRIADAEDEIKSSRIALSKRVQALLKEIFSIFGVKALESM